MRLTTILATVGLMASIGCSIERVPGPPATYDAATEDPVAIDSLSPPGMRELSFQSEGHKLNGLMYTANGSGPHPTVILLHGFAGNERNLDLAQAVRRSGANVLYFNYRGSWGSGGVYGVQNSVDDVAAAIEFLKSPEAVERFRIDPAKITLIGHSFGGFNAAMATAADPSVSCLGFLAGADVSAFGRMAGGDPEIKAGIIAGLANNFDPDGGPIRGDVAAFVQEIIDGATQFDVAALVPALLDRPVLMVAGSRDMAATPETHHQPIMAAFAEAGADQVTELVLDDDHYWSGHRVELARAIVSWLWGECWAG